MTRSPYALAMVGGLLAALSAICLVASASAQTKPSDISGHWKFKTDVLPNKGCIISGDITFSKPKAGGAYSCTFVSREDCDRPGGPTFTQVQQSCTVKPVSGELEITSTIDRIVDAGPADFKEQMFATQAYAPDHFKVHPKGADLVGMFHSTRQAPVRFWRQEDLIG